MTPSIDQTLHLFANLLPNWTLIPILTLLPNFGGFHRTLQRVRLANRGRLLLRTPGPVPFGTCICSNVETILSWTCHVYGPFEFRTSLGTSILLLITSDLKWLCILVEVSFNIRKMCEVGILSKLYVPVEAVYYFIFGRRGWLLLDIGWFVLFFYPNKTVAV